MTAESLSIDTVMPSATATEEEIRLWEMLPRDEQVRRLREVLHHPDCDVLVDDTPEDILREARARADARKAG